MQDLDTSSCAKDKLLTQCCHPAVLLSELNGIFLQTLDCGWIPGSVLMLRCLWLTLETGDPEAMTLLLKIRKTIEEVKQALHVDSICYRTSNQSNQILIKQEPQTDISLKSRFSTPFVSPKSYMSHTVLKASALENNSTTMNCGLD